jgi:putative glutamine amidotransferase
VFTGYGPDHADTVASGTIGGVVRAGGVPILLPVVDASLAAQQLNGIGGLILSGGHDLALPEPPDSNASGDRWIDPDRDVHELALWSRARELRIPVLGICRGAQLISHAYGGTLASHVDGHDSGEDQATKLHDVTVKPSTELERACGSGTLRVNTIHHQAVETPGDGVVVSGVAADGLIEAIESSNAEQWFVGVQWHPELMPESRAGRGLFEALISEARR